MIITDKEIIWDLEEHSFSMTNLETARRLMAENKKPITIKNINHDIWSLIWNSIDLYYSIGNRLEKIEQILNIGKIK